MAHPAETFPGADQIAETIITQLSGIPSAFINTPTFDNDQAFARHQKIAKAPQTHTYFTRPYTSQDKSMVENRIWLFADSFLKEPT